jgi:hypothetical protein
VRLYHTNMLQYHPRFRPIIPLIGLCERHLGRRDECGGDPGARGVIEELPGGLRGRLLKELDVRVYDRDLIDELSDFDRNGDFCITDTLTTIQTDTGTNTSVSFLTSLLTGSTSLPQSALSSGNICTGCVQGYIFPLLFVSD